MAQNGFVSQELIEEVNAASEKLHQANVDIYRLWLKYMLFQWPWWVNLALCIVPVGLWLRFRKKESTDRLLYAGFVVLILSSLLDHIGISMGLWSYNIKLVPLIPPFIPWDFILLPVTTMFFYQFMSERSPVVSGILFAALTSFIIEPIFEWLGFYNLRGWKNYYSFIIEFLIYLAGYWFLKRKDFEKL